MKNIKDMDEIYISYNAIINGVKGLVFGINDEPTEICQFPSIDIMQGEDEHGLVVLDSLEFSNPDAFVLFKAGVILMKQALDMQYDDDELNQ